MDNHFEMELRDLQRKMLLLSSRVEAAVSFSVQSLVPRNRELAGNVCADDDIIDLEKTKTIDDRLQLLQAEADIHIIALLRELFAGKYDPCRSMVLKDIFELVEKGYRSLP